MKQAAFFSTILIIVIITAFFLISHFITSTLLKQQGTGLDIIYEDPTFPATGKYLRIYHWNLIG